MPRTRDDRPLKYRTAAASAVTAVGLAVGAGWLVSALARRHAERRVPASGRFIDVDGARLHYVEAGEGPPILMVHGLGGQLRNFSYALLDRLARSHRVILLDRPGAGHSPRRPGYGIFEHAQLVARFIQTMELEEPIVAGHSFGGAVALALALDHPEHVGRLALIAPLSQSEIIVQQPFKAFMAAPHWLREVACRTTAVPLGLAIRSRVHRATFAPEQVAPDFDVAGGGLLVLRADALAAGFDEILTSPAALAQMALRYAEIARPVSILFGSGDQVLDPSIHGEKTAAMITGARLQIIDGGHMLPVTQPDAVANFILGTR